MALLELDNVTKRFGGLLAVSDVSFTLDTGEILSMIGPNGAGKTTAFNCVTGLFPITSGAIKWEGADITRLKPYERARRGIAVSSFSLGWRLSSCFLRRSSSLSLMG